MKNTTILGIVGGAIIVIVIMVTVINPMLTELDNSLYSTEANPTTKYIMTDSHDFPIEIYAEGSYFYINDEWINGAGIYHGPMLMAFNGDIYIFGYVRGTSLYISIKAYEETYVVNRGNNVTGTKVIITEDRMTFTSNDNDEITVPIDDKLFVWSKQGSYGVFEMNPSKTIHVTNRDNAYVIIDKPDGSGTPGEFATKKALGLWKVTGVDLDALIPFSTYTTTPWIEYQIQTKVEITDNGSELSIRQSSKPAIYIDEVWDDTVPNVRTYVLAPLEYTHIDRANIPISQILQAVPLLLLGGLAGTITVGILDSRRKIE